MMIDQITLVNVLSFLIWKINMVYDMAQRPPGIEKIKTFSKKYPGLIKEKLLFLIFYCKLKYQFGIKNILDSL